MVDWQLATLDLFFFSFIFLSRNLQYFFSLSSVTSGNHFQIKEFIHFHHCLKCLDYSHN